MGKSLSATPEDLSSIPSTFVLREQEPAPQGLLSPPYSGVQARTHKINVIKKILNNKNVFEIKKQERANYESSFLVSRTLAPQPGPFHRDEKVRASG